MNAIFVPQLPRPAAFELTHSEVNAEFKGELAIKAAVLRTLWTAWDCPEDQLDELAWAWSIDYWKSWWPAPRKRQVIAESPAYHRAKGKITADRMACRYADAELISYHLPRDGFRVGASPTRDQHLAWLQSLPEIRIYPLPPRPAEGKPLGGAVGLHAVFRTDQLSRARRAELRKGEQVIGLAVSGETVGPDGDALAEIERVSIPAPASRTVAVGRGAIGRPVASDPQSRRVFDFDWRPTTTDPFDLKPGVPSLVPAEATPRKVSIPRPLRRFRAVVGMRPCTGAVGAAPAREDYYLALRVADGTGPSGDRPRGGVVGRDRLPRARYTKELSVLVARPSRRGWPFSGARLLPDPSAKVGDVLASIAAAQALRDTVFVDFNVIQALTVADFESVTETTRVGATRMITRR